MKALFLYSEDPVHWLRLIFSMKRGFGHSGATKYDLNTSQFTEDFDSFSPRCRRWVYSPGPNATSSAHDYLLPEYQCHLPGDLIDDTVDDVVNSMPDIPYTPLSNIGMWANYHRKRKLLSKEEEK